MQGSRLTIGRGVVAIAIALVPVLVRAYDQRYAIAITIAGLAGAAVFLALVRQVRYAIVGAVVVATVVGAVFSRPALGIVLGVDYLAAFGIVGLPLVWAREPAPLVGRAVALVALVTSHAILIATPRVTIPIAITAIGVVVMAVAGSVGSTNAGRAR